LCHYFNSYKVLPGRDNPMHVLKVEGRESGFRVVNAAMEDYRALVSGQG